MFTADENGVLELFYSFNNASGNVVSGTIKLETHVPYKMVSAEEFTVPRSCQYTILKGCDNSRVELNW